MEVEKLKQIIEAALMVAAAPVSFDRLHQLFGEDGVAAPTRDQLRTVLEELENDYHNCGIELAKVGSGYRFQARAEIAEWINRLWEEKQPRYSRALLETLAIIAYRQPITRGEIESIRGVAVSTNIIRTLLEREWVRIVGHRDVPGKPAVYATTKEFLDYFNLASLDELPSLAELKDVDDINADLFAEVEQNLSSPSMSGPAVETAAAVDPGSEVINDGESASEVDFDDEAAKEADATTEVDAEVDQAIAIDDEDAAAPAAVTEVEADAETTEIAAARNS